MNYKYDDFQSLIILNIRDLAASGCYRQSPKISEVEKSEVTLLVSSWRPTTAVTTTCVRHERVPKLNPEDEQAVLAAAAAVQEKPAVAEDNDGDEARPLPQRASFAVYLEYPVSLSCSTP
jgi:hypothetical protein